MRYVASADPEAQPVAQLQFCNAVGSAAGLCTNATAAGATCQTGGKQISAVLCFDCQSTSISLPSEVRTEVTATSDRRLQCC